MEKKIPLSNAENCITGYKESKIASQEGNDCVVIALAAGTGVHYDKAHKFAYKELGRLPGKGVYGFSTKIDNLNGKSTILGKRFIKVGDPVYSYVTDGNHIRPFTYYKNGGKIVRRDMSVGTFIKQYTSGTYLICVRGHTFTIKDGIITGGNYSDSIQLKKIVRTVYRIED